MRDVSILRMFAIGLALVSCERKQPAPVEAGRVMTMCELCRSLGYYRGKMVVVRGVYYQGLRQACPFACFDGRPWPAAVDLTDSDNDREGPRVAFQTDRRSWDDLDRLVLAEAKKGHRMEVWVTVIGEVRARPQSPLDPCATAFGGFGHLGGAPAQLVVQKITNVEVRSNPESPYDYAVYLHPRAN